MQWVELPTGARSLSMTTGRYTGREGDRVRVSANTAHLMAQHAKPAPAAPVATGGRERWCEVCAPPRRWHAWSVECPRCGAATIDFQDG